MGHQCSFCMLLQELVEKLGKGELSEKDYPYINDSTTFGWSPQTSLTKQVPAQSVRSRRTSTWAQPRNSNSRQYSR